MKIYPYVNKLGVHKFVEVSEAPDENGLYSITGWNAENGEMCFFDNSPKEKIISFLANYGVKPTF